MESFLDNWRQQGPIFKLFSIYSLVLCVACVVAAIRALAARRDLGAVITFAHRSALSILMLAALLAAGIGARVLAGHFPMGESSVPMVVVIVRVASSIFSNSFLLSRKEICFNLIFVLLLLVFFLDLLIFQLIF